MKTLYIILLVIVLPSCAQVMAIRQPEPFSPHFSQDTKRDIVIGTMGVVPSTEHRENEIIDTFHYADGGSKNHWGWKTGRVIMYTGGDLFTLFISQLAFMPLEYAGFSGEDKYLIVRYLKNSDGEWVVKQ